MPADGHLDTTTDTCAICDHAIDGAPLTDSDSGRAFHPKCVVDRLREDAIIRVLGVLALIALPTVVVWAA